MRKTTTWILLADGARARLLRNEGPNRGFDPVPGGEFEGERRPTREIVSDRQGNEATPGGPGRHTLAESSDAHDFAEERFVKRLAEVLNESLNRNEYDRLVIVAPPKALGVLRDNLSKTVEDRVAGEINKDLVAADDRELENQIGSVLAV
jgi:protein required for attachment to host cells